VCVQFSLLIPKYDLLEVQIINPNLTESETLGGGCQWLTPVILATWEAEIRRFGFQGQPK
jgi:hypothetical protein